MSFTPSASGLVQCAANGCFVFFLRNHKRVYCSKHEYLARDAEKQKQLNAERCAGASAPAPPVGRVRRGHRELIEAAKRKFAKRAKPDVGEMEKEKEEDK